MKFIYLLIPLMLAGCSSTLMVKKEIENTAPVVNEQAIEKSAVTPESETIKEIQNEEPQLVKSTRTETSMAVASVLSEVEDAPPLVKKIIKLATVKTKKIIEEKLDKEIAAIEKTEDKPALPESNSNRDPMPMIHDAKTSFLVEFIGMKFNIVLGQNDSWSTILKMLTLLLVTYGGFKAINYFFDRRKKLA